MFISKRILGILYVVLYLFSHPALSAQETFSVSEVIIDINGGKTSESTVRKWIHIEKGQLYKDLGTLAAQVEEDRQTLINLRVFESVTTSLEYTEGSTWRIVFTIQDGWTFVPVPLVLYDSNEGLQFLYIQIWDNVGGSLSNWFTLTSFSLKENDDGTWRPGPWRFLPKLSNIKIGDRTYSIKLDQEYSEKQRFNSGILTSDYSFFRTSLTGSTEFPFGAWDDFLYTLSPGIEFRYGFQTLVGSSERNRFTFSPLIQHSLFYDTVDYKDNARTGIKAGITQNLRLNIRQNSVDFVTDFTVEFTPYLNWKWISYYPRISGIIVINDEYEDLGEPLRGIPNASMYGYLAIYMNQTLGLDIWRWRGVWDIQLHLFYDAGFAVNSTMDSLQWSDIRHAAGADLIIFIDKVPNLSFRFSWGIDLDPDISWEDDTKLEFIVRYSFSY